MLMHCRAKRGAARTARSGMAALLVLTCACEARRPSDSSSSRDIRVDGSAAPYQAEGDEGLGAAVAILIDTSGSMAREAPGDSRPKYVVAQGALEAMPDATDAFVAKRPDFPIKIGIYSFSSSVRTLRPIQPYDRAAIRQTLAGLPRPGGGTAIGEALREARPDLYRAGVFRKYLLVVTDGENTSGRSPDRVAREIFRKSEGAGQTYFVAVEQLKEGRIGLEQYRGLVERVTRQVSANRSHVQKLEAETKAYLKAGDRATAAKFALELQKAKGELASNEQQLQMHETAYGNNLKKIQHANEKLIELRDKIQKYDAELKMSSAEAEIAKLSETFDMNLTTDFGEIETVIQQKIDQNRGKVRVAADLSEKGIAEIKAEERMRGQLAEQALQSFEVELGIRSPETTPVAQTSKDLGPATTEKAIEKQTS